MLLGVFVCLILFLLLHSTREATVMFFEIEGLTASVKSVCVLRKFSLFVFCFRDLVWLEIMLSQFSGGFFEGESSVSGSKGGEIYRVSRGFCRFI